jgi:hypothetical protein
MEQITHKADVAEAYLASVVRSRARAEAVEWAAELEYFEQREAAIKRAENPRVFQQQAELSQIAAEIGRYTGSSESQVSHRVAAARRIRDHAPTVWQAFADGRVDAARAREIAAAIEKLQRPESVVQLDARVVGYAESHTVAELRRWLKLFVARVEADLFAERAEAERAKRRVEVLHGDDGMSWMTIYGPSFVIAASDKRLTKEAKAFGSDDPRTLQQRRADLAAAWLTTNDAREAAATANFAVTMPGHAVAGSVEAPAVAADGSWVAPVQWMLDLAKHSGNSIFWHRMILDPVTDDVLAHEYHGRFAPAVLAQALEFRDGVCQAPGCCRPAHACDLDHRIPHDDDGPTAARNMGALCRKHHKAKGFGVLTWNWHPSRASDPPGHPLKQPLHLDASVDIVPEDRLRRVLLEYAA